MIFGQKSDEKRREASRLAETSAQTALKALDTDDLDTARKELNSAPRKVKFAASGWKLELAFALYEIAKGKNRPATKRLTDVCSRLDETALSRDDKGYVRLFALYRAIEASKTGRAPEELRMHADNFRFDHTLVSNDLKTLFPLKKSEARESMPPPMSAPPGSNDDGIGPF